MFLGTYYHTVDERSRVSVPKRFRNEMGLTAVVTRGLDGCLFLFSQESWKKMETKLLAIPLTLGDARSFTRHLLSGAMDVTMDRLGRVLLPKYLLEFANLVGEVAVLGVGERIEIWNKEKWLEYSRNLDMKSRDIAERLSELGI